MALGLEPEVCHLELNGEAVSLDRLAQREAGALPAHAGD